MHTPARALSRADARAGWGSPRLDLTPRDTAARRLARAYAAGPLRDTAMITLGAVLISAGYLLHAFVLAMQVAAAAR